MKLSVPIHRLKRRARLMSRDRRIALARALDLVARDEGFAAWSELAARTARSSPAGTILARLEAGDLMLLGARPRQGKTVLGLEILRDAVREGRHAVFFTLELTERETRDHLHALADGAGDGTGESGGDGGERVRVVASDDISAAVIMRELSGAPRGTVAVVDYLQALDQRRSNPELGAQVEALDAFARAEGVILVFLSQIDRSYDPALKPLPDLGDIRLPNRLDPARFTKTCFLHAGRALFEATAP
ncbi:DNA helicase [Acuticoccus sediminis]|uniref:DNA helicase n=1 Tax=Acuticoccus sediminis TaxID=2184697 RepID=A0A8B2NI09_9HYPH|nr:DNA helicase [Acuticoccus sediminis]RAH97043.1 DNA helicase [Acuticoccus sediminis]